MVEWQTRQTQNLLPLWAYQFKSGQGHSKMKLIIEHTIPYELSLVEEILLDAYTWHNVKNHVPSIKDVKVIYREEVQDKICIRKWYTPNITVPWFAKGKIKDDMLEWGEMLTWCPQSHSGEFIIEPNIPNEWKTYFDCQGQYKLESAWIETTKRIVSINLDVKIPLFRGIAEEYIAEKVKLWYQQEAEALKILAAK